MCQQRKPGRVVLFQHLPGYKIANRVKLTSYNKKRAHCLPPNIASDLCAHTIVSSKPGNANERHTTYFAELQVRNVRLSVGSRELDTHLFSKEWTTTVVTLQSVLNSTGFFCIWYSANCTWSKFRILHNILITYPAKLTVSKNEVMQKCNRRQGCNHILKDEDHSPPIPCCYFPFLPTSPVPPLFLVILTFMHISE